MKRIAILLLGTVLFASNMLSTAPVSAATEHTKIVSANPADFTPQLPIASNTATYTFAQVGNIMYVGGEFTAIGGVPRTNIAAFDANTGAILSFSPAIDGQVWSIVPISDGSLIVGGKFSTVNGISRRGLVKIDSNGQVMTGFNAKLYGNVTDAQLVNNRVIISGTFKKKIAAIDPSTGIDTGYINAAVSGTVASNAGATSVYRFAVDPQNTRLVGIGNFTSVGGQVRYRAFMLDLGPTAATVSTWDYAPLQKMCVATSVPDYLRDVDFSPDGSYFAMVSTGYIPYAEDSGYTICDATARFESANLAPTQPTWINYTGGDTLHSVAITGATIYVGGHQKFLNNPTNNCEPGCVSRPGIGSIDPITGIATSWSPTRTRGVGAKVLYATPAGLWVGSDTGYGGKLGCSRPGGVNFDDCTGKALENHAGIGFLPLN